MIDLDELHNKMVSYVLVGFTNSDISPIDAIELLTRLRQAEKDAARNRWLRCMAEVDGADGMMISILISDDWDAAIDEAMQCIK